MEAAAAAEASGADGGDEVAALTAKAEKVNSQTTACRSALRNWQSKLEDEKLERTRAAKHLEAERKLTLKLRDDLEAKLDIELEQKSRVKMLESRPQPFWA